MPAPRRFLRSLPMTAIAALALAAAARADFKIEKDLALAPGGELVVDVAGGGVVVTGGAASGAHVLITADRDESDRYTFDLGSEPGRAHVTSKRKYRDGWFSWFQWSDHLRYEIRVPRQTRVSLRSSGGGIEIADLEGNAKLRSSGGGLQVHDVTGDVDADTSGGGVRAQRLRGNVRLSTSGGSIHASQVLGSVNADTSGGGVEISEVSDNVVATSSGGGVHVDDVGGTLHAESSGGPVTAVLRAASFAGGKLSSSGGGVRVEISPRARLTIDASASGGSVSCDLPVSSSRLSRTSLHGNLNGGGPVLELESSGGGVQISPASGG